jgi:hypothetical protein
VFSRSRYERRKRMSRSKTNDDLKDQRYELNSLLSDPFSESVIWRSKVIVRLDNIATLLGLELLEMRGPEEEKENED